MTLYDQLRTPRVHQALLIEPPPGKLLARLRRDERPPAAAATLLDTTVGEVRRHLRRRLALRGPIILTGHQAEFFHAGVFAKSIAADALARACDGQSVYVTVDSDTPKTDHLLVPTLEDGRLMRRHIPIPACDPRLPADAQPHGSSADWRVFFERVRAAIPHNEPTLLDDYARGWFSGGGLRVDFAAAVIAANAACEDRLGFRHAPQLRTSAFGTWPEFRALVAHLILHAERFRGAYNDAQLAFRRRHRVRSANRPVPPLLERDGHIELPFWVVRAGQPRRRLFVCRHGEHAALFADDDHIGNECLTALSRFEHHQHPWRIEQGGWRLRPRALTLSAFCRLMLADVFIHGIGGAKYDEMTADFVQRFWEVELAPMTCVTATLLLPLPRNPEAAERLAAVRAAWRDAHYNPQRRLEGLPRELVAQRAKLVAETVRLAREARHDHRARHAVYRGIREVNRRLLAVAGPALESLAQQLRRAEDTLRQHSIASDREVFYALHPLSEMHKLDEHIRTRIGQKNPQRRS